MNEKKKSECCSHKDLLYSEILNTSVTGHVRDLFEKKQKSSTYPIQKSTVLARASNFLKSLDTVEDNAQNIEDVEEGQPVIDMNVTLIQKADDSEDDSNLYLKDEDSDDETEDDESITSDSDEEGLDNMNVECGLHDESVHKMFVTNSEFSQNGSRDILLKDECVLNNLRSKHLESKEQESLLLDQKLFSSTDSHCKQSDSNKNNEHSFTSSDLSDGQFKSDEKDVIKVRKSSIPSHNSNQLSEEERSIQNRKSLEFPEPSFRFLNNNVPDFSCKHGSSIQSLDDEKLRKRKLIAVIEDDDSSNLYSTKTQKLV